MKLIQTTGLATLAINQIHAAYDSCKDSTFIQRLKLAVPADANVDAIASVLNLPMHYGEVGYQKIDEAEFLEEAYNQLFPLIQGAYEDEYIGDAIKMMTNVINGSLDSFIQYATEKFEILNSADSVATMRAGNFMPHSGMSYEQLNLFRDHVFGIYLETHSYDYLKSYWREYVHSHLNDLALYLDDNLFIFMDSDFDVDKSPYYEESVEKLMNWVDTQDMFALQMNAQKAAMAAGAVFVKDFNLVDEDVELDLDNPFEFEKSFQDAAEILMKDLNNALLSFHSYFYGSLETYGQDERLERVKIVSAYEKKMENVYIDGSIEKLLKPVEKACGERELTKAQKKAQRKYKKARKGGRSKRFVSFFWPRHFRDEAINYGVFNNAHGCLEAVTNVVEGSYVKEKYDMFYDMLVAVRPAIKEELINRQPQVCLPVDNPDDYKYYWEVPDCKLDPTVLATQPNNWSYKYNGKFQEVLSPVPNQEEIDSVVRGFERANQAFETLFCQA